MTGRSLIISENARAVLLAARDGTAHAGLNPEALAKCVSHGWVQFAGEDGELLALTKGGIEACQKVKL